MTDTTSPSHNSQPSFRVVENQTLYEWHAFRLIERKIASPSDEVFVRTFLDSPGAVGALAIDSNNNVVLVEQYRPTLDGMLWEIPAGMRDKQGEDPLVTAQRELEEEAGFIARSWRHLGHLTAAAGVTNSIVRLYLATDLTQVEKAPDGPEEEYMKVVLMPFAEALAMVRDGRISDSKSMVALLLAAETL